MPRIITIGREFGSGGRELGRRIADDLKIAYYDNEIITRIAERTDLSEDYVKHVMESEPSALLPITVGRSFYMRMDPVMEQNNAIYREQSHLILELAEKSDCVIVGRSADYILRQMQPFRLFVYAQKEHKLERCRKRAAEQEHFTDRELWRHIRDVDRRRARYYQFFTGQTWGDRLNYDLCINTSNAGIKELAEAITRLVG
ncbi:MAG: cytidylate kinase-like family protein [Roseburia sp.]|jgi:cytidylate kinase|nr:cytidylate kinase-like family protein [Roseburia sp.]